MGYRRSVYIHHIGDDEVHSFPNNHSNPDVGISSMEHQYEDLAELPSSEASFICISSLSSVHKGCNDQPNILSNGPDGVAEFYGFSYSC